MAETLLTNLLNKSINPKDFHDWLFTLNHQTDRFALLSAQFKCAPTEFITYFLNFVHEDISSEPPEKQDSKASFESEFEALKVTSTPKMNRLGESSPISPLYRNHHSFTTPKTPQPPGRFTPQKSPIVLGDFMKPSTRRRLHKSFESPPETTRRIKPTNLTPQKINSFHKTENSFNFNKSQTDELPHERTMFAEERLKILTRPDIQSVPTKIRTPLAIDRCEPPEPRPDCVTHRAAIDQIVTIYHGFFNHNYVINPTSEIYFLVSLLVRKQYSDGDLEDSALVPKALFHSVHNVVYFAARSLEVLQTILRNYDGAALKCLQANQRLRGFAPRLIPKLGGAACERFESELLQDNVCFNSDTDNRQNFPNDPSFHAFRKQRDLFYEILRVWEVHHLAPGFSFQGSLGGKVRTLLGLYGEPVNYVHFARLFKGQLLGTCRGNPSFLESIEVDAQKLSRLTNRCVTKARVGGAPPGFSEAEEFYREFIVAGASFCFNRHLADALVGEIVERNGSDFAEVEDKGVDSTAKKSFFSCVKALRLLAKFLGFIESLPYMSAGAYPEQILVAHVEIRKQIQPNFDIKTILAHSITRKSLILCIPWLTKYLSMLDYVTLRLPYYTLVLNNLIQIYKNFNSHPLSNVYLVKFCLGWLFELPHFPDYFSYRDMGTNPKKKLTPDNDKDAKVALDNLQIVDQNIIYFCCPYLDDIKQLLCTVSNGRSVTIKHITPVTALQSPRDVTRKKIEQQLEEAFFNGQPISMRKTVEFVSERIASTCVKHICSTLVPKQKKRALEQFREIVRNEPLDDLEVAKVALRSQSKVLAVTSLKSFQVTSNVEIERICREKIAQSLESLLPLDILAGSKAVCTGIAERTCLQRVNQWTNSHVTQAVFLKDFNDEINKLSNCAPKKAKKVFLLPPGGTKANHDDSATSAAHLLEKITDFMISAVERKPVTCNDVMVILDEIGRSFEGRGDINDCICSNICSQLVDLSVILLSYQWDVMLHWDVMSKLCFVWRLRDCAGDDLCGALLCPRNFMVMAQSRDPGTAWSKLAEFCARLVKAGVVSCASFEAQCTALFRTNLEQATLRHVTNFLRLFVGFYRKEGGSHSNFTFLLDFLSDYCEDLF